LGERVLEKLWRGAEPMPGGRGSVRLCLWDGRRAVVKKERRGGFAAHFLPDLYAFRGPFLREEALADRLQAQGLTPPILGREFIRHGPLSTVYTLVEYAGGARSVTDLWIAGELHAEGVSCAGRAVGRLHKAAVLHGDLNAGNILIATSGEALFLDLRHSKQLEGPPSPSARRCNCSRLARSLHKIAWTRGLAWPPGPWKAFAEGYAEGWGEREPWLDGWTLRCVRGFPFRRLFWPTASRG
jgi:tRNA A-37 threonylcarbamoyl transferase component Bud32